MGLFASCHTDDPDPVNNFTNSALFYTLIPYLESPQIMYFDFNTFENDLLVRNSQLLDMNSNFDLAYTNADSIQLYNLQTNEGRLISNGSHFVISDQEVNFSEDGAFFLKRENLSDFIVYDNFQNTSEPVFVKDDEDFALSFYEIPTFGPGKDQITFAHSNRSVTYPGDVDVKTTIRIMNLHNLSVEDSMSIYIRDSLTDAPFEDVVRLEWINSNELLFAHRAGLKVINIETREIREIINNFCVEIYQLKISKDKKYAAYLHNSAPSILQQTINNSVKLNIIDLETLSVVYHEPFTKVEDAPKECAWSPTNSNSLAVSFGSSVKELNISTKYYRDLIFLSNGEFRDLHWVKTF